MNLFIFNFKNVLKEAADNRVLPSTDQKNMFDKLVDANKLLEEIQKGLNNYLEKKRLFFARF